MPVVIDGIFLHMHCVVTNPFKYLEKWDDAQQINDKGRPEVVACDPPSRSNILPRVSISVFDEERHEQVKYKDAFLHMLPNS